MKAAVVSLFPEMFRALMAYGVSGRAVERELIELALVNPRKFATDRHQTVDHRPYGGGPGMVMAIEPLRQAIQAAKHEVGSEAHVVYMSPQGRVLDQAGVERLAAKPGLVLVAGRYEGIDERLIDLEIDEECSLGDFVLSGGELAAMTLLDAVIRLLPGALGHQQSAQQDSFSDGLLDCPHFTRPECYEDLTVPKVLLSGNHEAIRRWRLQQSLGRTWQRRPELLQRLNLDDEQQALLAEFIREMETAGDSN